MAETSALPCEAPPGNETLRRRSTLRSTVCDVEKTEHELVSSSELERIDYGEAIQLGLPPLTFRPSVLTDNAMYLSLVFYVSILTVLVFLCVKKEFSISYTWAYFAIQLLPTILGTITAMHLEAIVKALSRITPFIMCADGKAQDEGAPADKTLLVSYFPSLDFTALSKSRNGLLMFSWVMDFGSVFIVSLKANFLLTSDYESAYVVPWAIYTLIAFYGTLCVFLMAVFLALRGRITGLRWDPVSIADQLVLFRHSDFLDRFSGTCITSRQCLNNELGQRTRLRLGYWKKGCAYWHGFGIVKDKLQSDCDQSKALSDDAIDQKAPLKGYEIADRRYSSASATVQPWATWLFPLYLLILLVGSLVFLIMGSSQKFEFQLPFSSSVATALFSFVLSFFIELCTSFFESLACFMAITEPFVHLAKVEDGPKSSFGNAGETLLLDYTNVALPIAIYTSFTKGHWKVFRTMIMGRLQHLFPIIVAGSFTIYDDSEAAFLRISLPLFVIISIWLFICLIWVPFEILGCEDSRFLPRSLSSTADLLSWAYASSILRGDLPASTEYGFHNGDPLDIRFFLEDQNTLSQSSSSRSVSINNDSGVPGLSTEKFVKKTAHDRHHLKARLTLTNTKFCFGLNKLKKDDLYTVGICDRSTFCDYLERPKRDSTWLQHIRPATKIYRGSSDKCQTTEYMIEGWHKFQGDRFEAETQRIDTQRNPILIQENEPEPDN